MIGAMPAVAVRHERRRNEKRGGGGGGRRPSQLPLQLGRPGDPDATPSPDPHRFRNELYICGKVALLHGIVGALLLGIVVLVVGLVQLSPGAEAAQHRYYLMGAGAALAGGGVLAAVLRCVCLHWFNRKYGADAEAAAPAHKPAAHGHAHAHGVSLVDAAHTHGHAAHTQGHAAHAPGHAAHAQGHAAHAPGHAAHAQGHAAHAPGHAAHAQGHGAPRDKPRLKAQPSTAAEPAPAAAAANNKAAA